MNVLLETIRETVKKGTRARERATNVKVKVELIDFLLGECTCLHIYLRHHLLLYQHQDGAGSTEINDNLDL